MKKIIYIAFAAAALAAVSCAKNAELNIDPAVNEQGLTLQFFNSDMATRATVDGVNNENLIKRIDYFFFPVNAEGKVDDETEYVYKGTLIPEDDGLSGTYTEVIEPGKLAQIFPNGATKAVVFAVANYVDKFGAAGNEAGSGPATDPAGEWTPNTTLPEEATTWKDLHELEVGPTFFKDGGVANIDEFLLRWPRVMQPDEDALFFVMVGEEVVELETSGSHAVDATIPLKRLASKVTVNFTYENFLEEKESGKIMWIPQDTAGETRVYLSNGIEHTTLGGPLTRDYIADSWGTATKPLGSGTRDIFEYAYNYMNDVPVIGGKKTAHFYTYPINAKEGDDNQPYLKLVLPWYGYKYFGSEENPTYSADDPDWVLYKQKEVYYKIVLPRETIKDPNCIYEYSVNVNIIGSDKEVKIIGEEYVVKDWLSDDPIKSNVATGLYISLDIPKDEYDMYVDELDINFVSSGTVVPIVEEIYQLNYSSATGVTRDYFMQDGDVTASPTLKNNKGLTNADIEGWVSIPNEASYLKINHAMDNRMTINGSQNKAFDMAPYVFQVRLHLVEAGDDSFDRVVKITQYPALYVASKKSNGYTFVNKDPRPGSVYDDRGNSLGNLAVSGTLDGTGINNSPFNYIITTSMLSKDLKVQIGTGNGSYKEDTILGDPRTSSVDNLENLALTNYRPTNPEGTRGMIAPKLLIASSYGAASSYFNLDAAEKRCASYQENGYPAGRWRVPTLAEITFMMTLSNMNFIPSLFRLTANDTTGYWCANGKVSGDSQSLPYLSTYTSNTSVRCVYDAWYWGEEPYQENATTWLGFRD